MVVEEVVKTTSTPGTGLDVGPLLPSPTAMLSLDWLSMELREPAPLLSQFRVLRSQRFLTGLHLLQLLLVQSDVFSQDADRLAAESLPLPGHPLPLSVGRRPRSSRAPGYPFLVDHFETSDLRGGGLACSGSRFSSCSRAPASGPCCGFPASLASGSHPACFPSISISLSDTRLTSAP